MKRVAAAVIIENGRLLIARRAPGESLASMWELPGGKVEQGESGPECLARELREELGLEAAVGELVAESHYVYEHGEFAIEAYLVERLSSSMSLTVHDAVKWVHPTAVSDYDVAPADWPLIEAIRLGGLL